MTTVSGASPSELVRPLTRVRQIREFRPDPPTDDQLDAILDAARWSGSSTNSQPWRFVLTQNRDALRQLHEAGLPQTRALRTAPAAISIAIPDDENAVSHAFDEGRVAERILIAAEAVGLRAGIAWIRTSVRPLVAELLGIPQGWFVRTVVVVGHPTEAALVPKSKPGEGRLRREQVVFREHWQD
jgi:nitroreductase